MDLKHIGKTVLIAIIMMLLLATIFYFLGGTAVGNDIEFSETIEEDTENNLVDYTLVIKGLESNTTYNIGYMINEEVYEDEITNDTDFDTIVQFTTDENTTSYDLEITFDELEEDQEYFIDVYVKETGDLHSSNFVFAESTTSIFYSTGTGILTTLFNNWIILLIVMGAIIVLYREAERRA